MAPDNKDYVVRDAKSIEEVTPLWWPLMKDLGWNRSLNDATTSWNVSRSSKWLVVHSPSTDKPEGTVVPFVFDNSTGWVGFFIVDEAARGKGWGAAIFRELQAEFKRQGVQYIGLDGVTQQKETYERRGFRVVGTIRNMYREGLKKEAMGEDVKIEGRGWKLVDIRSVDVKKLVGFEEKVTGFRRSRLWSEEGMFHRAEDDAFGFAATNESGTLAGFTLVRACEKGYRFGPVSAATPDIATALLRAAMQRTGELNGEGMLAAEVYMSNPTAVKLFDEQGWKDAGVDYYRMWVDGKATPQQSPGGIAEREYWAIYDASEG